MRTGASTRTAVRVRAPAKINLFLAIRGRRHDGMHEVVSVMHTVSLYDEVTARLENPWAARSHPAGRRHMQLFLEHDSGPDVPSGEENLALRAARSLADHLRETREMRSSLGEGLAGREHADTWRRGSPEEAGEELRVDIGRPPSPDPDVPVLRCAEDVTRRPGLRGECGPVTRLRLEKRIPVAAGMAGGSADAAATLLALNRLWGASLAVEELTRLAAGLGADVPFCLTGGSALATGTGTNIAPVLSRGAFHWVVGIDDQPLPTAEVYKAWDRLPPGDRGAPEPVLQALRCHEPEALGAALHNDLEHAALHLRPGLREGRRALLDAGALGAVVSGSGPTLLGLARDERHARQIAVEVADHFDRVEVVRSPAGGPAVIS